MEKAIKILAIYTILLSLYSVIARLLSLGYEIPINIGTTVTNALLLTPVVVLSVLVFFCFKKQTKVG
jgi:hypothetical protein